MGQTFKSGLTAATLLLSGTALSQAADLPARTAPSPVFAAPVLVSGWDGFYAGSTYGYDFTQFHTRQAGGGSRNLSKSGQSGGGFVGYNYQVGHVVVGAEGGIDLNLVRGNAYTGLTAPTHLDSLYDIRLRGRLGYEFGWFMPFIAGGAVINETYQSALAPSNDFGQNHKSVGYTIGGGVDVKVNPAAYLGLQNGFLASLLGPLVLRVEYIHDGLPTSNYAYAGQRFRTSSDTNLVRVALIQRFGDNPPRPYVDAKGDVNWAGGYGGVFGGGGFITPTTRNLSNGLRSSFTASGAQGGLFTGTNFIFAQHYMLGVEGSTAFTDITGRGQQPGIGATTFRNYINADLRARAGYAFGSYLPFVAAGIAYGRSEQIAQATGSQLGRVNNEAIEAGGGIDYRISERVSLRGEYIHEFGFNHKIVNLNDQINKQTIDGDFFRIGAAYHFE